MQDKKKNIKNLEWFLGQPVEEQLALFGHYGRNSKVDSESTI